MLCAQYNILQVAQYQTVRYYNAPLSPLNEARLCKFFVTSISYHIICNPIVRFGEKKDNGPGFGRDINSLSP